MTASMPIIAIKPNNLFLIVLGNTASIASTIIFDVPTSTTIFVMATPKSNPGLLIITVFILTPLFGPVPK
jgi:hypothetical protein